MGLLDIFNGSSSEQIKKGTKEDQIPSFIEGAFRDNDLHSTGQPGSNHVHRNIGLKPNDAVYFDNPDALGVESTYLRGSIYNDQKKYQNTPKG